MKNNKICFGGNFNTNPHGINEYVVKFYVDGIKDQYIADGRKTAFDCAKEEFKKSNVSRVEIYNLTKFQQVFFKIK